MVTLLLATFVGCQGPAPPATQSGGNPKSNSTATTRPDPIGATEQNPPAISPATFATVHDAVEALCAAAQANDRQALQRAEAWLALRGGEAATELGAVVNDEQADPRRRLAACRAVAKLGPAAKPVLFQAMESPSEVIRNNATLCAAMVKPVDGELIDRLVKSLDHDDQNMRRYAIQALQTIGLPAKASVPALQDKLNDPSESPEVRDAAKLALKSIDPRRTLQD